MSVPWKSGGEYRAEAMIDYVAIITGCLFMLLGGVVATALMALMARWAWTANNQLINDEFDPWNQRASGRDMGSNPIREPNQIRSSSGLGSSQ